MQHFNTIFTLAIVKLPAQTVRTISCSSPASRSFSPLFSVRVDGSLITSKLTQGVMVLDRNSRFLANKSDS